ncbi:hypothetical protein N0V90_011567 [Kalmusia sp. IMI 367209]|nr:hypothetical protein N0V90_011567 [Kalmusia sp. IMI 367209]
MQRVYWIGSPLIVAIGRGHMEIVKLLLAQQDIQFNKGHSWPKEEIKKAVPFGQSGVARALILDARFGKISGDFIHSGKTTANGLDLVHAVINGEEELVSRILSETDFVFPKMLARYYLALRLRWVAPGLRDNS